MEAVEMKHLRQYIRQILLMEAAKSLYMGYSITVSSRDKISHGFQARVTLAGKKVGSMSTEKNYHGE